MLVLTRKVGEGIKIGDDVFVYIKEVKGKQVRVGIEAPRETRIQREELDPSSASHNPKNTNGSNKEVSQAEESSLK